MQVVGETELTSNTSTLSCLESGVSYPGSGALTKY